MFLAMQVLEIPAGGRGFPLVNIIALPELVSGVGNLQIVELQIKVL